MRSFNLLVTLGISTSKRLEIIFQRQQTEEALNSKRAAKRIRMSADAFITSCPSPSGLAGTTKETWEASPQVTRAKKCTGFVFMLGEGVHYVEPELAVL